MKHKKLIFFVATAILSLGIVTPFAVKASKETLEPDNAIYGDRLEVDYDNPDEVFDAPAVKRAVSSASSIKFHYHNDDGNCLNREFWVWCDGVNGSAFAYDSDGTTTDITLSISFTGEYASFAGKDSVSFIIKMKDTWAGQSENLVIKYEEFPPNDSGLLELWCIPGEGNAVEVYKTEEETHMDRFQLATFEDWKTISVIATNIPVTYRLYALTSTYMSYGKAEKAQKLNDYLIASGSNPTCTDVTYNSLPCKRYEIKLNYTARPNVQYYLEGVFPEPWSAYTKTKYVSFDKLYETSRFETYYNYNGDDLGATYNDANSTTFRVWAPTAARVLVYLYNSGTSEKLAERYTDVEGDDTHGGYNMAFRPGGIWQVTIKGKDLNGKYYTYYVVNSLGTSETIDPYAKACGVNGDRGMIVDWRTTDPTGWDQIPVKWDGETSKGLDIKNPNDLSICETHIRDLTCDPDGSWTGSSMKGTYSAFVEGGTKVPGSSVTSGYDHLVEMGYKAIHLLPVFDNDNNEDYGTPVAGEPANRRAYNWGYNPKNYNCVEGGFATDPYNGASRIKEFKELVQKFATNENHTRIIMDVVYNHVSSAPASSFNKLMPKYYFRYWSDIWHENDEQYWDDQEGCWKYKYHDVQAGAYCDGSGCGNEVKSEAPMMSKYIVDSLCWWAQEYKIKGFRFDLMGLIDFQTIKKAAQELYKIDPDILIYGEGWTGDGDHAHIENFNEHCKWFDPSIGVGGGATNWGSDTWTVYNKLYRDGDMCYVATFNDAGRNALKGGNDGDMGNAWGFITKGTDVGKSSIVVADMMVGYHNAGNGDDWNQRIGANPNQSISYASCHDNFALFDTLVHACEYATYENPLEAVKALTAVETAIMYSNGIALMQGGEELFRTKEVTTQEDLDLITKKDKDGNPYYSDTYTNKSHLITHNAYNLSDSVNAFRWGRKVSIGSVNTLPYVQEIAKAIHKRNELPKYDYDYLQAHDPFNPDAEAKLVSWGRGDGSNIIGVRNDNNYCFVNGVSTAWREFGLISSAQCKVTSRPADSSKGYYNESNTHIRLDWYTTVWLQA